MRFSCPASVESCKVGNFHIYLFIYISGVRKPSLAFDFEELTCHDGHLFCVRPGGSDDARNCIFKMTNGRRKDSLCAYGFDLWSQREGGNISKRFWCSFLNTNISFFFLPPLSRWSWKQQRKSCKNLFTEKAPWMSTKMFQFTKRETPLEHKWGS